MPQTRRRPAETGRGGDDACGVRADAAHYTTADYTAVDRLPPPTLRRYLADCAMWRTIHAHHRAIMRLLTEAAR